jgi:hypothetical protein
MPDKAEGKKHAAVYTVDTKPGEHRYASVDGVGECRDNFRRLIEGMERGDMQVVVALKAEYFFIDTSPMWMEKFIATAQRRGITIADATTGREYDLLQPEDEADFRKLGKAAKSGQE